MLYSEKVIKDTDMNIWKDIYIRFFKIRRRIIGRDGADEFAAMLFVAVSYTHLDVYKRQV